MIQGVVGAKCFSFASLCYAVISLGVLEIPENGISEIVAIKAFR